MDTVNKVQALMRSEAYARDYQEYLDSNPDDVYISDGRVAAISRSEAGRALCRKYLIRYPVNPEDLRKDPGFIDTVFPAAWENPRECDGQNKLYGPTADGELQVSIDLTRTLAEIENDIGKLYHHYIDQKNSDKKSSVDHWDIYDQAVGGASEDDIALQLGQNKDTAEKYAARLKVVKRAVKKSKDQLHQFEAGVFITSLPKTGSTGEDEQ